jgi:hypothetical protein
VFTFRPTARLAKRLGVRSALQDQPATTRLGDWYGNLIYHGSHQMILCTSDKSLLTVVLPARDAKRSLVAALPASLGPLLRAIGVPAVRIQRELDAMRESAMGKPLSRSVLGSMNDLPYGLLYRLDDDPGTPFEEVALDLAETLCSPLGYDSPRETARRLLA